MDRKINRRQFLVEVTAAAAVLAVLKGKGEVEAETVKLTPTPTPTPTQTPGPDVTPTLTPTATGTSEPTGTPSPTATPEPGQRPNFLFIVMDDLDYRSWAQRFTPLDRRHRPYYNPDGTIVTELPMSFLQSRPGAGWTSFDSAYCVGAICAPSRASMLTGVAAGTPNGHGVTHNGEIPRLDDGNTLPVWLAAEGYECSLFGKYSFSDHRGMETPPGWTNFDLGGRATTVFTKGIDYIQGQDVYKRQGV